MFISQTFSNTIMARSVQKDSFLAEVTAEFLASYVL